MYLYEATSGLYVGRRLKYEHVHLTSYSKMKVNLAAQVIIYTQYFVNLVHV